MNSARLIECESSNDETSSSSDTDTIEYYYLNEGINQTPFSTTHNTISIVLCLYTVCSSEYYPFVQYVESFPRLYLDIAYHNINQTTELFVKNKCWMAIFDLLENIHKTPLDFKEMYKGYLPDLKEVGSYYFFWNMSNIPITQWKKEVSFCLLGDLPNRLSSLNPSLSHLIDKKGNKIINPTVLYSHYSNVLTRYNHEKYGCFYYFSDEARTADAIPRRYAVFLKDNLCDFSANETGSFFHSMFYFRENGCFIVCVKSKNDFFGMI